MTPSNTLSSTEASRLALKVIESPIIKDYLAETHGVPELLTAHVPNDEDWWDTCDKHSYCMMLSRRHKRARYSALMDEKKLRWPDLSTFNGPSVLRFAYGDILRRPPTQSPRLPGRSEIYEIKPDNKRGHDDAQGKLRDVEDSYARHGVSGIYRRGVWYPFAVTKRIDLKGPLIDLFKYLVNLYLRTINAEVVDIQIKLRRADSGVLLYKICVTLDGLDQAQRDTVWVVANFCVRTLSRLRALTASQEVQAALEKTLLLAEPVEPPVFKPHELPWIIAGKDYRKTPYLEIKPHPMVGEIEPQLDGIRATMYSRLIGAPGERYFICCDEAWYLTNVRLPGMLRAQGVANLIGTGNLVRSVHARSLLGLAPTIVGSVGEIVRAMPELALRLAQWVSENPGKTLIIIGVTICVTALIIVTAGAAAAPVMVGAEAGAMGTGAIVATEAGAMAAPIMTATAGAEVASVAALPVTAASTGVGTAASAATATSVGAGAAASATTVTSAGAGAAAAGTMAGETGSAAMLTLLRTMATQVTAAEVRAAGAQQVVDNLLIRAVTSAATREGVRQGARTAVNLGVGAAATLVAVAPSRAYAYSGPVNGSVTVAQVDMENSVDLSTGHVYLVRVPRVLAYPNAQPPALHAVFNANSFAQTMSQPDPALAKVRMLGSFDVV